MRPVLAKVRVYAVLAVPLIPTPLKVATPFTAFRVTVPTVDAPALTDIVTEAVLEVTVLPPESRIATTGWVVNAAPLTAPAAEVVSTSCDGVPAARAIVWVAAVKFPLEKVNV